MSLGFSKVIECTGEFGQLCDVVDEQEVYNSRNGMAAEKDRFRRRGLNTAEGWDQKIRSVEMGLDNEHRSGCKSVGKTLGVCSVTSTG